ncbi:MAG: hypothetical protein H8K07_16500 [Nitrospira sp.]|nr:hypothetical protein [Nitrospira sp.]
MAKLEVHEWTSATRTAAEVIEYECIDDGRHIVTARWVQRARQAFLDGNLAPLLALRHTRFSSSEIAPSPHLSQLCIDLLTGKIKRPKHRPKPTPLTHNEIMEIGMWVRNLIGSIDLKEACRYRDCCPSLYESKHTYRMKLRHAIARVAEGIPEWTRDPLKLGLEMTGSWELEPPDIESFSGKYYLPPIPINRVEQAYDAFLKLQGQPRPWDGQPCKLWKAKPPKKKPTTTTFSRLKQSSRTT